MLMLLFLSALSWHWNPFKKAFTKLEIMLKILFCKILQLLTIPSIFAVFIECFKNKLTIWRSIPKWWLSIKTHGCKFHHLITQNRPGISLSSDTHTSIFYYSTTCNNNKRLKPLFVNIFIQNAQNSLKIMLNTYMNYYLFCGLGYNWIVLCVAFLSIYRSLSAFTLVSVYLPRMSTRVFNFRKLKSNW